MMALERVLVKDLADGPDLINGVYLVKTSNANSRYRYVDPMI